MSDAILILSKNVDVENISITVNISINPQQKTFLSLKDYAKNDERNLNGLI